MVLFGYTCLVGLKKNKKQKQYNWFTGLDLGLWLESSMIRSAGPPDRITVNFILSLYMLLHLPVILYVYFLLC